MRRVVCLHQQAAKVVIDQVIISDEVAANPDDYEEISEEYHDELDVTKPETFWRRTIRKKFVLKSDKYQLFL